MSLFNEKVKDEFVHLTSKQMEKFEEFVVKNFGNDYQVMHELVSPDIHLDVLVFNPTKENNCYTLVTMGMCGYKMDIPKEYKNDSLERAELIIQLPSDWNIKSNEEKDYWPIRQIKSIARMPIYDKTYLAGFHTVNNGSSVAPNTDLTGFILLPVLKEKLNLKGFNYINFYTLMPLYKEELEYIYGNGINKFMDLCEENALPYPPVVDINRKNMCEK